MSFVPIDVSVIKVLPDSRPWYLTSTPKGSFPWPLNLEQMLRAPGVGRILQRKRGQCRPSTRLWRYACSTRIKIFRPGNGQKKIVPCLSAVTLQRSSSGAFIELPLGKRIKGSPLSALLCAADPGRV